MGAGYSNRNGIGALVTLYEEGHCGDENYRLGLRQVEAYGGIGGQNSIDIEYGLPNDEFVDIQVIWPGSDGTHIEENWLSIERGQFLTLYEGEGVGIEQNTSSSISATSNLSISPNPSYGEMIISFNLSSVSYVSVRLFDLMGRSVEKIETDLLNQGEHSVLISEIPPGIYLCQVKSGEFTRSAKLIVL